MFNLKVFEEDPEEETSISKPVRSSHQQTGGGTRGRGGQPFTLSGMKDCFLCGRRRESALIWPV